MKKVSLSVLFVLFCGVLLAQQKAPAEHACQEPKFEQWSAFQLGLLPYFPPYTKNSRVIGVKTGWPICNGKGVVDGFECSWLWSGTHFINGCQASLVGNEARCLHGFQPACIFNMANRCMIGFQASGIFNMAGNMSGAQAGGFNLARTVDGCQAGVLGNVADDMCGLQIGLLAIAGKTDGVQISVLTNIAKDAGDTIQIGLFNFAGSGKGFQFGLINIIKGGWVPFLPFFNVSM